MRGIGINLVEKIRIIFAQDIIFGKISRKQGSFEPRWNPEDSSLLEKTHVLAGVARQGKI